MYSLYSIYGYKVFSRYSLYSSKGSSSKEITTTQVVVFYFEGDSFRLHSGMARDLVYKRGELREGELSRDIELFQAFYCKQKQ